MKLRSPDDVCIDGMNVREVLEKVQEVENDEGGRRYDEITTHYDADK